VTLVRPVPQPTATTAFHWEATREGRLLVQRCATCGRWAYPPTVGCAGCGGGELVPTAVSGRGVIYSFTVVRQAFDQRFAEALPYVVALVDLEEGARLMANVVDADPAGLAVGMPVELTFETVGDQALAQFRPC
jgi:uncharacterized OB-fold protein